jgi:hypothetical protein
MSDLKPCPWCNSTDVEPNDYGADEYFVCRKCNAYGPIDDEDGTLWNTRAAPAPAVAALQAEVARLRAALQAMVDEKCDYMLINHLGDPEGTHTIDFARAALSPKD